LPKRILERDICAVCGNPLHTPPSNTDVNTSIDNGQIGTVISEAVEVEEEKVNY
jgi:hypothetical protein